VGKKIAPLLLNYSIRTAFLLAAYPIFRKACISAFEITLYPCFVAAGVKLAFVGL
jgi:hypothetical protein